MKMTKVFVYGTLKRNRRLHGYLEGSRFIGKAEVKGKLYMEPGGAFPFAKLDEDGVIHGEVFEVNPGVLAFLDALEGHPDFYCRTPVPTDTHGEVQTYHYVSEVRGCPELVGGVF